MSTPFETNESMRRKGSEFRESGFENKESKEKEEDKKMEAKEKMELTIGEVKNTKSRMKNIMVNMQQVLQAVRQIRQQLNLNNNDDDIPAVKSDQKTLDELKLKLADLMTQVSDLKLALRQEEIFRLRQIDPNMSNEELKKRADEAMEIMLMELGYMEP